MDRFGYAQTSLSAEDLERSDEVYGALTQAVRELAGTQLTTEVDLDEAAAVTQEIRALTARLASRQRAGSFGAELTDTGVLRNHGNTVTGLRNPFAVANGEHPIVWNDTGASASLHLGPLCEGPPGHVHGGVLALVLDQLLGEAAASAATPGMTGTLSLRYRRPTPLGDVSMEAWLDRSVEYKTYIKGHLKDADGNVTVEAEGLFLLPRWAREQTGAWPSKPPKFE